MHLINATLSKDEIEGRICTVLEQPTEWGEPPVMGAAQIALWAGLPNKTVQKTLDTLVIRGLIREAVPPGVYWRTEKKRDQSGLLRTFSGRLVNLLNPDPRTIDIVDIAHALARIPRYNTHTKTHYSVAEHSCHLSNYFLLQEDTAAAKYAHIHDGPEAYLGDPTWPVLQALGPAVQARYHELEGPILAAILQMLGWEPFAPEVIERVTQVDRRIFYDEQVLLKDSQEPGTPLGISGALGWSAEKAENEWMAQLRIPSWRG